MCQEEDDKMYVRNNLNLWDTSSRFKNYTNIINVTLRDNQHFLLFHHNWKSFYDTNKLYNQIIADCGLHRKSISNLRKFNRRPKLFMNGFRKLGLVYSTTYQLTQPSKVYLSNKTSQDMFEQLFNLKPLNLLMIRQLLKLRLYHSKHDNRYLHPIDFMILMLIRYHQLSFNHFYSIFVLLPRLKWTKPYLKHVIKGYQHVRNHVWNFNYYLRHYFFTKSYFSNNTLKHVILSCKSKTFDINIFRHVFKNGKSIKSSQLYADFIKLILQVRLHAYQNPSQYYDIIKHLVKLNNNSKIKKAFGFEKPPFAYHTVKTFAKDNLFSNLLHGSVVNIYHTFVLSKAYDIVREYANMNRYILNLSKLFIHTPNGISLNNSLVWNQLIDYLKQYLVGNRKSNQMFYKDVTLQHVFHISKYGLEHLLFCLENHYHVSNYQDLKKHLLYEQQLQFNDNIKHHFSISKIIKIMKLFNSRTFTHSISSRNHYDKRIQKLVGSHATVPTICEFISGIAWWYLSNQKLDIYDAFNLIMNGEYRPVSQAPGGMSDLCFQYPNKYRLSMEVTLQNASAQKKGEIEPVERHSVNLTAENRGMTKTIFIAPIISYNTKSSFLSAYFEPKLDSRHKQLSVHGVTILCATFNQLISALQKHSHNKHYTDATFLHNLQIDFNHQIKQRKQLLIKRLQTI